MAKKLSGGLATVELAFGGSSSNGSSIWIRWHDVSSVSNWGRHPNIIHVEVNKRKKRELLTNKRGIPKTKIVTLTIKRNQKETKIHFKQRESEFSGIMKELFSQYQTDIIPPTSDSRT